MGFYEERLIPMIKKTVAVIEATPHMQDILHGTMPEERFHFQIKQNYNYLMEFARCWAVGLAQCNGFEEMKIWYDLLVNTMEDEVILNRDFWAKEIGLSLEDMEAAIMAPGKRTYTSFELARAWEGDLASQVLAVFACAILYLYMGDDLLPQCALPEGNRYRFWLEFYTLDKYREHCAQAIALVNKLTEHKSERELAKLQEIFACGCNYEILQWQDMYYHMRTWPLDEIFPPKFTTIEAFKLDIPVV
jgi:thiaminase/transcriptional activator TenA